MNRLSAPFLAALIATAAPALADSWALQGYDAVSYVVDHRAEPGRAEIHTKWKGLMWLFATEDHRAAFEGNPRAYAPGFNGLCPVALSEGRREPGHPEYFAVIGDRLYLLRGPSEVDALNADPRGVLSRARKVFSGE